MSQENVEIVLSGGVAVLNAAGARRMSWPRSCSRPDCRIENVSTAVTDRTYYGVNGVREWRAPTSSRRWTRAFDALRQTEILADGEDFVVTRGADRRSRRSLGRGSRAALGQSSAGFVTAR